MKTILVPIDFSPITAQVTKEAADLARATGARLLLLTVVQPAIVFERYDAGIDLAELTIQGEKNAARQLEEIAQTLKSDFLTVETVQVTGSPMDQIVEHAKDVSAAYIVMGSHGHTSFYDLLVGSTTHGVLKRAKCPVVIIPALATPAKPAKA